MWRKRHCFRRSSCSNKTCKTNRTELRKLKKEKINIFVQKHQWVGTHGFEGPALTKKKIVDEWRALKAKKKDSGKKLKKARIPQAFEPLIKIGSELAFQRSNLMETIDRVTFSHWSLLKKIGQKQGLTFLEVVSMTPDELINFIDRGKIPQNLKERKKHFGVTFISGKTKILLGRGLKKELLKHETKIKKVSQIKGMVAFPGQVKGVVKILQDQKDVSKVNKGDIIVAPETTPDYILALRKASAFVTNQGGITSHAAIVSREMKKPCIIGTKIATKVLKDGDKVEIDATKGIVKIFKKE